MQEQVENTARKGIDERYICDPSLPGIARHLRMMGIDTAFDTHYSQAQILFIARTQDRIIITKSLKLVRAIQQWKDNFQAKYQRLQQFQSMLEEYLEKSEDEQPDQQQQQQQQQILEDKQPEMLIFEHEKHKHVAMNEEQMRRKIEMLEDDLDDPLLTHQYTYYIVKTKGRKEQLREVVNEFELEFLPERLFKYCGKCGHEIEKLADKTTVQTLVDENTYKDNQNFGRCRNASCADITWGTQANNEAQEYAYQKAMTFCTEFSFKRASI